MEKLLIALSRVFLIFFCRKFSTGARESSDRVLNFEFSTANRRCLHICIHNSFPFPTPLLDDEAQNVLLKSLLS